MNRTIPVIVAVIVGLGCEPEVLVELDEDPSPPPAGPVCGLECVEGTPCVALGDWTSVGEREGPASIWLHATDYDADGDVDLLVSDRQRGELGWYQGDGRGNFGRRAVLLEHPDAWRLATADFDGDGDLDVAVSNVGRRGVVWYPQEVLYSLGAAQRVNPNAPSPTVLLAGDIDGDGDPDVAAVQGDGRFAWFPNDGRGGFAGQVLVAQMMSYSESVQVVDLDGDGDLDFVAGWLHDDVVAWHRNRGDGTFDAPVVLGELNGVGSVSVGDLNGDGWLDVAASSSLEDTVWGYLNQGDGTFAVGTPLFQRAGLQHAVLTDLDRDGALDLAYSNWSDVGWYRGDGNGAFEFAQQRDTPRTGAPQLADLNGDGAPEILFSAGDVGWYMTVNLECRP